MLIQKVIKVGNSVAVVLPAEVCASMKIQRGDFVVLVFPSENHITLDFAAPRAYPEKALELYKEQHNVIQNGSTTKPLT